MSLRRPFEKKKKRAKIMFFKPLRSFSHTNIKFSQLTKCATSHIITLTSVCLFPVARQARLRLSTWPTLKQKARPRAITLLLRTGSPDRQHWNHWTLVGNAEPRALSLTYGNRIWVSIRFPGDFPCTLDFVKQGSSFYCGVWRATRSTVTTLTVKQSQTKSKLMTYFEPNP